MNTRSIVSLLKVLSFALIVSTACSWTNIQGATNSFELATAKEQLYATIKVLARLQQTQDALLQNSKTSFVGSIGNVGKEIGYLLGATALGTAGTLLCLESIVGTHVYNNHASHDEEERALFCKAIPAGVLSIIGSYILLKIIFKGLLGTSSKNDTAAIQESLARIDETLIKLISAAKVLEQASA